MAKCRTSGSVMFDRRMARGRKRRLGVGFCSGLGYGFDEDDTSGELPSTDEEGQPTFLLLRLLNYPLILRFFGLALLLGLDYGKHQRQLDLNNPLFYPFFSADPELCSTFLLCYIKENHPDEPKDKSRGKSG